MELSPVVIEAIIDMMTSQGISKSAALPALIAELIKRQQDDTVASDRALAVARSAIDEYRLAVDMMRGMQQTIEELQREIKQLKNRLPSNDVWHSMHGRAR